MNNGIDGYYASKALTENHLCVLIIARKLQFQFNFIEKKMQCFILKFLIIWSISVSCPYCMRMLWFDKWSNAVKMFTFFLIYLWFDRFDSFDFYLSHATNFFFFVVFFFIKWQISIFLIIKLAFRSWQFNSIDSHKNVHKLQFHNIKMLLFKGVVQFNEPNRLWTCLQRERKKNCFKRRNVLMRFHQHHFRTSFFLLM